jgi:putative addiction module CopG family antidote
VLGHELEEFVQEQVDSGAYASASEVVRAGLTPRGAKNTPCRERSTTVSGVAERIQASSIGSEDECWRSAGESRLLHAGSRARSR